MTMKMLTIAALAFSLTSGIALAQTTSATPAPGESDNTGMPKTTLEDPSLMAPFYTDNTMTTIRPLDEMKSAWAAMTPENQTMVRDECTKTPDEKYKAFCDSVRAM